MRWPRQAASGHTPMTITPMRCDKGSPARRPTRQGVYEGPDRGPTPCGGRGAVLGLFQQLEGAELLYPLCGLEGQITTVRGQETANALAADVVEPDLAAVIDRKAV